MPERDQYTAGVPCWVDSSYQDPEPALKFYGELFGWQFQQKSEATGERFYIASINGKSVGGIAELPSGHEPVNAWNTYVAVDSADTMVPKVTAAGGEVVAPAFDVLDAGRMAIFKDSEGALFSVWQAGRTKGAQLVNEHGALNFNTLATADTEKAKAFYKAVFGWGTYSLGGEEFWTLPGYGDEQEARNPGTHKQMEEMGASGFEDVVAAIQPAWQGVAPHWGVTFAANDAVAVAHKAESLGGKVVTPPTDAVYARYAVLADPLGTSFVAGQFVPENAPSVVA